MLIRAPCIIYIEYDMNIWKRDDGYDVYRELDFLGCNRSFFNFIRKTSNGITKASSSAGRCSGHPP